MLRFQHTSYLLLLAAIPLLAVLYFFVINWKKKTIKKIGDENLVKELIRNYSSRRYAIKFLLIISAFMLGVFALANLRKPGGVEKVNRSGIDVMIALDVSKSMLADDIKPNRLERAKQSVARLIDKLSNDRIGIVVFAGRAYLQMPLTGDHGAAKMYLSSANTDVVPTQGTVIADALKMCYSAFNPKEKKYKAVVLISDGEDHDEGALKTAGQMAADGIIINTVGIGSPQGATFMDELTNQPKMDNAGNIVISKLNEDELKKIASEGKGSYQLFSNTDDLVNKLEGQLENMDQRSITEDSQVNYQNFFPWFLAAALILLLAEFFISETKRQRISTTAKRNAALGSLLLVCLFPTPVSAQNEKALIKKGNEAYEKKEYGNAVKNYQQATDKKPGDPVAQYNLGNALYKNNKAEEAVNAYDQALANSSAVADKAKTFYNKGVVLQNNKKLPECIEAYKNALKLDPKDEDARLNLQRALQQQKQQEQKKDNKENKEKKKPKEDEKQKEQEKQKQDEKNEQPKPQPSKLTKQDAEEKLKALLQQEKNLQDKLRKVNTGSVNKPEKDW